MPSQRAWLIREGIEDFDLLKIAEKRLGKDQVAKIISQGIPDPMQWHNDVNVFEKIRLELGNAVEKAGK